MFSRLAGHRAPAVELLRKDQTMQKRFLLTPGPTPVPPEVLSALSEPVIHHRAPRFTEILKAVVAGMKYVYQTTNDVLVFASSGTGSMESAVVNLVNPGDHVLVASMGNFGERWLKLNKTWGAEVTALAYEWGTKADPKDIATALAKDPAIKAVFVQFSETSTGVVNDIKAIGDIVAKTPAVLVVDAISGLGASDLKTDEWHVDVCLAGSQKALMVPPGLAYVAVSDKAWKVVEECTQPRFYFDWVTARKKMTGDSAQTPYTPAVSLMVAQNAAIALIKEEGLENVFERHRVLGKACKAGVKALGLELFGPDDPEANSVTAVKVPAGIGGGNVDVKEATKRGVIVVNAPQSNVLSAAEQTIALMMACARNLAQAHADLKAGKWEKGKWSKGGVELRGKTLGILGLGRIGFLVAEDARGLAMNVLAYDPFVPAEKFHELGLERADSPDRIYREADFITVHLPKNAETLGFVDDDAFAKMKDGVRVINVARGGIIDEDAWARAIESGKVAASAVDVYPKEPTTESPLFKYDSVVATPHLGASTVEAQLRAGTIIAEQVAAILKGEFASNAVNIPLAPGEDADELMPFLGLCKQLGKLIVQIADGPVDAFEIGYGGGIARYDTRILTLGVLQGVLADKVDGPVNFVNVQSIAEERGISAKETKQPAAVDFLNLITVTTYDAQGELSVSGTTLGPKHRPRFVKVYRQDVDIEPAPHMVFLRYADVPGMIGKIGTKMGEFRINIGQMGVGREVKDQKAVMGLTLDEPITAEQLAELVASCSAVMGSSSVRPITAFWSLTSRPTPIWPMLMPNSPIFVPIFPIMPGTSA